jgi:hypothetical protein
MHEVVIFSAGLFVGAFIGFVALDWMLMSGSDTDDSGECLP